MQAQWYQRVGTAFQRLQRGPIKHSFQKLDTYLTRSAEMEMLSKERLQYSVLELVEKGGCPKCLEIPVGTAFVFEENLQGHRQLWGITAAHYHLKTPAVREPYATRLFDIHPVAVGGSSYTDLMLFPLPQEISQKVTALPLAPQSPKPKEQVYSAGFYSDGFNESRVRRVKHVTPARLVTSYAFGSFVLPIGACGGPVLNQKHEVVGVHCGSDQAEKNSFAVPVEHIYKLVNAYYQGNKYTHPIIFNGEELAQLTINESVYSITTLKDGVVQKKIRARDCSEKLDYTHLENLLDISDADEVIIEVRRYPFSVAQADQTVYTSLFIYTPADGKVMEMPGFPL